MKAVRVLLFFLLLRWASLEISPFEKENIEFFQVIHIFHYWCGQSVGNSIRIFIFSFPLQFVLLSVTHIYLSINWVNFIVCVFFFWWFSGFRIQFFQQFVCVVPCIQCAHKLQKLQSIQSWLLSVVFILLFIKSKCDCKLFVQACPCACLCVT